ncbi:MAG: Maf family nucleotide pyrophosphatase [Hyphomicrobium sp.]
MTSKKSSSLLLLASSSPVRRQILHNAGLLFEVRPSKIDEEKIREQLLKKDSDQSPSEIALLLAEEKGLDVSKSFPHSLVVGCDQVLTTGSEIFSKPKSLLQARQTLEKLRGKTHYLHSGVVLAKNGVTIWREVDTAKLTMHSFTDPFLEGYLKRVGETVLGCVGAYQFEGLGVCLFEQVQGDYYTILGLPLLPLLRELRRMQEIDQ